MIGLPLAMGRSLFGPLSTVDLTLKYEDTSSRSSCADTRLVGLGVCPSEFLVFNNPDIRSGVIGLFELGFTEMGRAQVGNNYTSTGFRPTDSLV